MLKSVLKTAAALIGLLLTAAPAFAAQRPALLPEGAYGRMMGSAADLEARMKALPQERRIGELSAGGPDSLAKLVGSKPAALQDYGVQLAPTGAEAKLAVDGAARAGPEVKMPGDGNEASFDRAQARLEKEKK